MKVPIRTLAGRDQRIEANRRWHHEAVVIVGMFPNQIDTARSPENERMRPMRLLEPIGKGLRGRVVTDRRTQYSLLSRLFACHKLVLLDYHRPESRHVNLNERYYRSVT